MQQQPPDSYWQWEPPEASPEAAPLREGELVEAEALQGMRVAEAEVPAGKAAGVLLWAQPDAGTVPAGLVVPAPVDQTMGPRPPGGRRRLPWVRTLLLAALVVGLAIVGSISGVQAGRAHQQGQQQATSVVVRVRATPASPSPSPVNTVTPTPSPQPIPQVLAQDSFARPNQALWGRASDGSVWAGDANRSSAFSIRGQMGVITGGQGFFTALLGPQVADEDVQGNFAISLFDAAQTNLGVVLRWTDSNDYYKAYLDGASLVLIKRVGSAVTRLAAVAFPATAGVSYTLRFRAVGQLLSVAAWRTGTNGPANWQLTAVDNALSSGLGGLRILLENGVVAQVTHFQARSGDAGSSG